MTCSTQRGNNNTDKLLGHRLLSMRLAAQLFGMKREKDSLFTKHKLALQCNTTETKVFLLFIYQKQTQCVLGGGLGLFRLSDAGLDPGIGFLRGCTC